MQQRLQDQAEIPAPRLLGYGSLYPDEPEPWPYLITERLRGAAWRDVHDLTAATRSGIGGRVGEIIRALHDRSAPTSSPFDRDWLTQHGSGCLARLTADATHPPRLLEQVEDYLAPDLGAVAILTR